MLAIGGRDGADLRLDCAVSNSILWDPDNRLDGAFVDHSSVSASTPGIGNITLDPLFRDPAGGDYRLGGVSPCVDAGDPQTPLLPPLDINGNLRTFGVAPDLGAFESLASCSSVVNVGLSAGGPFAVLLVNGVETTLARVTQGAPMTITVQQPPTTASPASFYVAGYFGRVPDGSSFPLPLGIGEMCFTPRPIHPQDPRLFDLAESSGGLTSALMTSHPAPWTGGLLPPMVDYEATLQGICTDDSAPSGYAVTNAVEVISRAAPLPEITSLAPSNHLAGGDVVHVVGDGFDAASTVLLDGSPVPTSFLSENEVTFVLATPSPCDADVAVENPAGFV